MQSLKQFAFPVIAIMALWQFMHLDTLSTVKSHYLILSYYIEYKNNSPKFKFFIAAALDFSEGLLWRLFSFLSLWLELFASFWGFWHVLGICTVILRKNKVKMEESMR